MIHDRAFHVAIAGCLGNAVLVRVVGELFDQRLNPYFSQLAHYFESPRTWRAALDEHRAVRDAIVARDPERARDAMRDHLARSQERFARNFGAETATASPSGRGRAARPAARPSKPKQAPKKRAAGSGARKR
jgi:DNA-binding GntR family transcriptional regulator